MKNLFHISILVTLLVFFLPDRSFAVLQAHPAPPKQESFWKRLRQTSRKYIREVKARYRAAKKEGLTNRIVIGVGLSFSLIFLMIYLSFKDKRADTFAEAIGIIIIFVLASIFAIAFFMLFLFGILSEMVRLHSARRKERKLHN